MNEKKDTLKENVITRRIGSTTYKLKVFFSETAKETMEDKILRMIKNEVSTKGRHVSDSENSNICVCLPENQAQVLDFPKDLCYNRVTTNEPSCLKGVQE